MSNAIYAWLCQSYFSFLQSASSPQEIVTQAHGVGYKGVSLCDFDGVYGLVQGYKATKDLSDDSFRMFYGAQFLWKVEIDTQPPVPTLFDSQQPVFWQNRFVVVATHKKSYGHICELATYVHRLQKQAEEIDCDDEKVPWPRDAIAIIPMRGSQQLISPYHPDLLSQWITCVKRLTEKFDRV